MAPTPRCYAVTAWRRTESERPATNIRHRGSAWNPLQVGAQFLIVIGDALREGHHGSGVRIGWAG
jgi:hypothetical protein